MAKREEINYEKITGVLDEKRNCEVNWFVRKSRKAAHIACALLAFMLVSDVVYLLSSVYLGTDLPAFIITTAALAVELATFITLAIFKFNVKSTAVKLLTCLAYLLPAASFVYYELILGFTFAIALSALRLLAVLFLLLISIIPVSGNLRGAIKTKTGKGGTIHYYPARVAFMRKVALCAGALFVTACAFASVAFDFSTFALFGFTRRVAYSYNEETSVCSVEKVTDGMAELEIAGEAYILSFGGIKKYPVKAISSSAFKGTKFTDSVTIPENITSIDAAAFEGSSLKKVEIKSSEMKFNGSLANSGIEEVRFTGKDVCSTDLTEATSGNVSFIVDRTLINEYRKKYVAVGAQFAPKVESDEIYVNFNNTEIDTLIAKKGADGAVTVADPFEGAKPRKSDGEREYQFVWWNKDGETKKINLPYSISESVNLFAEWSAVYNIGYELNEGSVGGALQEEYFYGGSGDVVIPSAEREGYTFRGWYDNSSFNGTAIDKISETAGKDFTLYAKFLYNYSLKFDFNNGAAADGAVYPEIYHEETDNIILAEPVRRGYDFSGWYTADNILLNTIPTGTTGDIALKADWKAIKYDINYVNADLVSGLNGNEKTYTVEDEVTLNDLSLAGYTFDGWYSDAALKNKVNGAAVAKDSIGGKTFYAGWILNSPDVSAISSGVSKTYNAQGSNISVSPSHASTQRSINYSYQWYKADGAQKTLISDAVSADYAVKNVDQSGDYLCEVTASDGTYTAETVSTVKINVFIDKAPITIDGINAANKIYDGGTDAALVYNNAVYGGIFAGDSLAVTADGAFADKNAGADKTVNISNLTLGGASVNNYKLAAGGQQSFTTAAINAKAITAVGGIAAENKIYDGNAVAQPVLGGAVLTGMIDGDDLSVGGAAQCNFANKNAGTGKTVTITGMSLGGADADNYSLSPSYSVTARADITPKEITVNWGINSFIYDGASHKPTATAGGLISGEICGITVTGERINAGENYVATAVSVLNANYKLPEDGTANVAFTIEKRSISSAVIAGVQSSVTYKGTAWTFNITVSDNTLASSNKAVSSTDYTVSYLNNIDAGASGGASVTVSGTKNFKDSKTVTFTIDKKQIAYVWQTGAYVYNGAEQGPSGTAAVAGVNGEMLNFTIGSGAVNAGGGYTRTAVYASVTGGRADKNNYDVTNLTSPAYSVSPKNINTDTVLSGLNAEYVYNGTEQKPAVSLSNSAALTSADYEVVYSNCENAGTATLTVTGKNNFTGQFSKTYLITPKEIMINWGTNAFVYDGALHKPAATAGGLISGESCDITVTGERTNAGENYVATAVSVSDANYKLPAANTKIFGISAREITVSAQTYNSVYGEALKTVTPLISFTNGGTGTPIISGDTDVYSISGAPSSGTDEAKTYALTVAEGSNRNYTVTCVNGAYTIGNAEITVQNVSGHNAVYDGLSHSAVTANTAVSVNGQTITWEFRLSETDGWTTVMPHLTNVSDSAVVYYKVTAPNHNEKTGSVNAIVSARDISAVSVSVNGSYTYSGLTINPEYTVTDAAISKTLASGVDFTAAVSNNVNAGTDTATITLTGKGNYDGATNAVKRFSIEKALLTVTAEDGETVFNREAPSFAVGFSGFVNNQTEAVLGGTLGFDCDYSTGKNADTYSIIPKGLTSDNYEIRFVNGKLTVKKATVTGITFESKTVTYDGQPKAISIGGTSLPDGVTAAYTCGGETFNSARAAGVYVITAEFTVNGNYNAIGAMTAVLTIKKAEIDRPAQDTSAFVYNGSEQTYTVAENAVYTVSGNKRTNAGTQTVTVALNDTDNYKWTGDEENETSKEITFDFVIAAKDITVAINAVDKIYDGNTTAQLDLQNAVFNGICGGDELTVTANGAFEDKNVGAGKTVNIINIVLGGADKDNYSLTATTALSSADITAKTVTVKITPNGGVYGAVTAAECTLSGNVEGETVEVALTYTDNDGYNSATVPVNAGNYTVIATISDTNYYLAETSAQFVIEKVKVATPVESDFTYDAGSGAFTTESTVYAVASLDKDEEAGTAQITVTLNDTVNYEWADGEFGGKLTLSIPQTGADENPDGGEDSGESGGEGGTEVSEGSYNQENL